MLHSYVTSYKITWVPSGFSGYIWLDTKIALMHISRSHSLDICVCIRLCSTKLNSKNNNYRIQLQICLSNETLCRRFFEPNTHIATHEGMTPLGILDSSKRCRGFFEPNTYNATHEGMTPLGILAQNYHMTINSSSGLNYWVMVMGVLIRSK